MIQKLKIFGGWMGEPYWPQRVLQQSGCKLRIYAKLAEHATILTISEQQQTEILYGYFPSFHRLLVFLGSKGWVWVRPKSHSFSIKEK